MIVTQNVLHQPSQIEKKTCESLQLKILHYFTANIQVISEHHW